MCSRGAIECICALGGGEPGGKLGTEVVKKLTAACDTLRQCASGFTKLSYREHAAEAHVEHARCLRSVTQELHQTCMVESLQMKYSLNHTKYYMQKQS